MKTINRAFWLFQKGRGAAQAGQPAAISGAEPGEFPSHRASWRVRVDGPGIGPGIGFVGLYRAQNAAVDKLEQKIGEASGLERAMLQYVGQPAMAYASDGWAIHRENTESDVRELAVCFGESEKRSAAANGFSCRARFPDGNPA